MGPHSILIDPHSSPNAVNQTQMNMDKVNEAAWVHQKATHAGRGFTLKKASGL